MTLTRDWIASPNYSSRGGATVKLLIVHTAEGALTYQSLGNYFANPSAQVSSHVGIDDTPDRIGEYVKPDMNAWCAGNVNGYSDQVELCAFAAWTRSEWEHHPVMLENLRGWLAEESARFGIPLVKSTSHGVCGHVDVSGPGGHWDPGPEFPWDLVLAGTPAPTPAPPATSSGSGPPWPGVYLSDYTEDPSVTVWQGQMVARGWYLVVDGAYGPASAEVCAAFQADSTAHGWPLEVDAVVGEETWRATWERPVS